MTLTLILYVVILLLTLTCIWRRHVTSRDLPPSPAVNLPLLGHLLILDQADTLGQFQHFRQKAGDIYRLHFGPKMAVVFNGYDVIKEAFTKRGDDFIDGPFFYFDWANNEIEQVGIFFSSGHNWKEQRSVVVSILRDLGMGKKVMAEKIQEEVDYFLSTLASANGEAKDFTMTVNMSTANIIASMLVGRRFDYDDAVFKRIVWIQRHFMTHLLSWGSVILQIFPILYYLPGDLFRTLDINRNRHEFRKLFVNRFKELKKDSGEEESNDDNFIAKYMHEMKVRSASGKPTYLDELNMERCVEDLFVAGSETVSTTINWFILYMMHNQNIQEQIFSQINDELGMTNPPSIHDRPKLSYLNAAIMETQRVGNVGPMVLKRCARDVEFRGFHIPKGTTIMSNLSSVLNDTTLWGEDINVFRPDRFLDEYGKLKHFEELIPFSVGKRHCPGEGLAKMELFLYLASLCQRFKVIPRDPDNVPEVKACLNVTRCPEPYEARFVDRRSL